MDLLADILSVIDLRANLYFRAELGKQFAIEVPENSQFVRFHLAGPGSAWIGLPSGESTYFSEGDLVLIPHGNAHVLANYPDSPALPLEDVLALADTSHVGCMRYGEDAGATQLICGHFSFDASIVHPIVSTLPPLIHISRDQGEGFDWLIPLLSTMHAESRDEMPGYEEVLIRLSEIIFIQVLRTYMQHQPNSTVALTALADQQLGPVLKAIHGDPGFQWSLERLSEVANMSRSVFAEKFKLKFAMTPMRYVTAWRIQKARIMLSNNERTIAEITKSVGYASDAAFSKVFKEYYGVSPGAYRRSKTV